MGEEGDIGRVAAPLAEAGEERITEGIQKTEVTDGIEAIGKAEAAISGGTDPEFVDSSNKDSIAHMAITVTTLTTKGAVTDSSIQNRHLHRSNKGKGRTIIHGRGFLKSSQCRTTPER